MRFVVVLVSLVALGCASIVSKSSYPVSFDSSPSGAQIVVTNSAGVRVYEGSTPTTITLSAKSGYFRRATYTIEATMDGQSSGRATLTARMDGWYWANIAFGGLIGMIAVDPSTGAMWRLDERVVVTLGGATSSGVPRLHIVSIDQIPDEWREHLVPLTQ